MVGSIIDKQLAFFRRNWLVDSSYKVAFALEVTSAVVPVISFYFISRLVTSGSEHVLGRYGVDYFEFVLVGVGLTEYFKKALATFSENIQRAQTTGVMEAVLSTQTTPTALLLYDATYSFVMASLHVGVIFAVGAGALGADFSRANLLSVILVGGLSIAAFAGFGILSAALLVVLKKGDPIAYALNIGASVLAGSLFPITLLPGWLQTLSYLLPMTHGLEALRLALFRGYGVGQLWASILPLAAMALVLLPFSLWLFTKLVELARRDGTLLQY
jgi:ABC-2 type transport system permease protein